MLSGRASGLNRGKKGYMSKAEVAEGCCELYSIRIQGNQDTVGGLRLPAEAGMRMAPRFAKHSNALPGLCAVWRSPPVLTLHQWRKVQNRACAEGFRAT